MGDVIELADYRAPAGNGAREALIEILMERGFDLAQKSDEEGCDIVLAELWMRGFKVIPLEPSDDAGSESK